jgi:hypothetical protein
LLRNGSGPAIALALLASGCFTDPVNMPPNARIDELTVPSPAYIGQPVTYSATVSDPDGDRLQPLGWGVQPGVPCPAELDVPAKWPASWLPSDVSGDGHSFTVTADNTGANYCLWLKVTDVNGAATLDARQGIPDDRAPTAVLTLASPADQARFPMGTMFELSGAQSSDPDPGDAGMLTYSWKLKSAPSSAAALGPCTPPSMETACLVATTEGDYDVELRVDDNRGEESIVDKILHVEQGPAPVAKLDFVSASPHAEGPPYALGSQIEVTCKYSTPGVPGGPSPTCDWSDFVPPPGSKATILPCMDPNDGMAECFVADLPGPYHVGLLVTDANGKSQPVDDSYAVADHQPPCIEHTTPALPPPAVGNGPAPFTVVSMPTDFVVDQVWDDFDPDPPNLQWFVEAPGSDTFAPRGGFPSFPFNPAAFSFGDIVRVRLEIQDRDTVRGAQEFLACGNADVCSAPNKVHTDACLQRVTWTVHVLP